MGEMKLVLLGVEGTMAVVVLVLVWLLLAGCGGRRTYFAVEIARIVLGNGGEPLVMRAGGYIAVVKGCISMVMRCVVSQQIGASGGRDWMVMSLMILLAVEEEVGMEKVDTLGLGRCDAGVDGGVLVETLGGEGILKAGERMWLSAYRLGLRRSCNQCRSQSRTGASLPFSSGLPGDPETLNYG